MRHKRRVCDDCGRRKVRHTVGKKNIDPNTDTQRRYCRQHKP